MPSLFQPLEPSSVLRGLCLHLQSQQWPGWSFSDGPTDFTAGRLHVEGLLGLHWAHLDNLSQAPYFKINGLAILTPLPCKVVSSQVAGVRTQAALGDPHPADCEPVSLGGGEADVRARGTVLAEGFLQSWIHGGTRTPGSWKAPLSCLFL